MARTLPGEVRSTGAHNRISQAGSEPDTVPDWMPVSSPRYGHCGDEEHNPGVDRLPSTDDTRARMSRQRSRDTSAEMSLRRELHRVGLRYRVHRRPLPNIRREADVVFGPAKVAVFVD